MKIGDHLDNLPSEQRERLLGRIEGMTLAMRICRNLDHDVKSIGGKSSGEAINAAAAIRFVQVQFGSGRQEFFPLTEDEQDEIWRIY